MNDEKNSIGNKKIINSTINKKSKNKNDKLQKMVQQTDSFPESLNNMKMMSSEKNTNENHTKRQKSLCYDFKKGHCRRRFCRVSFEITSRNWKFQF